MNNREIIKCKIIKITNQIALTTAGSVAYNEMLASYLTAELDLYELNKDMEANVDVSANIL